MHSASITQHHHGPVTPGIGGTRLLAGNRAAMYTRLLVGALAVLRAGHITQADRECTSIMGRLVMKFGGTSVANIDRIRNVARHVKREVDAGHDVAVVVSAMAGKTNELVEWCEAALKKRQLFDARE